MLTRAAGPRRERGAVAMIVAVVLGATVLLGMSALVVDVGQLYAEREELQSGADAAAAAVFKACATKATDCDTPAKIDAIAERYADSNAKDDSAEATVCGRGWALATCGAEPTNLTRCVEAVEGRPTAPTPYVEVRAVTRQRNSTTVLPPAFSRGLAGRSDEDGVGVAACARVKAIPGGPPMEMVSPAITVEECFHKTYTANGQDYSTVEKALYLKAKTDTDPCNLGNGSNAPGNFGWLEHNGDCAAAYTVSAVDTYTVGDPGNNTDAACRTLLDRYIAAGAPMPMPLFDVVNRSGSNALYHITGFAAFKVTGYHLSGASKPSVSTNTHLCSGDERCLYGYFVKASFPVIRDGGPNFGLSGLNKPKLIG